MNISEQNNVKIAQVFKLDTITNYLILLVLLMIIIPTQIIAQSDTIRVACIGNSITEGDFLPYAPLDSYPPQLQIILGEEYQVTNFGKSGRTMMKNGDSPYWNEQVFTDALNSEPDIVTILLGTNDSRSANRDLIDDNYYDDYQAMIDTFAQLETNPKIWICFPPPSFSDSYSISNSAIVNKINPKIDSLLENNPDVSFIDFYNNLLDDSDLFPDGIHPSADGAWKMANIIADSISDSFVGIETVTDENLAKNKSVTVSNFNAGFPAEGLNDGDRETKWSSDGFNNWAVIDIGESEEIDMFQIYFGDEFFKGFQYTIDLSSDSIDWTTVVDQSARDDTVTQISVDKIDPITAQYIKITVTGASNTDNEMTSISEFKILKSGFVHSPVLSWSVRSIRSTSIIYDVDIVPTSYAGEMIKYYKRVDDGAFSGMTGFREEMELKTASSIQRGLVHQYYTETYKDGKMIISDTLTITFEILSLIHSQSNFKAPESYKLQQNYPNPFNPQTTIMFSLDKQTRAFIQIYDVLGRKVRILGDRYYNAGNYSIDWDGRDSAGRIVTSGVYYYRLKIGDIYSISKKMLFIK